MRTAAPETTTPESTAETLALLALASTGRTPENLVRIRGTWVDRPVTSAADRERARAMSDYRASVVALSFDEVTIQPGCDTRCCVGDEPLPEGATGYRDKRDDRAFDDSVLCVDCKEIESEAAGELEAAGRKV